VLRNESKRSYIGISSDPVKRLEQHNRGESTWTAKHRPWTLEWTSRALPNTPSLPGAVTTNRHAEAAMLRMGPRV
jgi:predicted GIY-YIG superfamily endonuclease